MFAIVLNFDSLLAESFNQIRRSGKVHFTIQVRMLGSPIPLLVRETPEARSVLGRVVDRDQRCNLS